MSRTAKTILWVVIIVIVVVAIIAGMRQEPATTEGPIKIGVSLPLTGDLAFIGEADRNAALLAIEEINNNANLKHKYELVIDDDSFDAAKASGVIQKFISIDKVNAVISVGSTAGNVVAPIAEANKLPHIGMASDPVVAKGNYNFINWTRPQEEVDAMISEMRERNITKVAIIGVNQQGFQAINTDFKTKALAAGITFEEEVYNPGQTDFRTIITKLQKGNPQIYLIGAFDPEVGIIGKQIQNRGIKTPLTSIESFGLTSDPKPFEGQWFVDATVPTGEFNTKFEDKYGAAPGPAAANVYDSIHLLVLAFENASENEKPTSDKVVNALGGLNDYNGALGALTAGPDGAFISQAAIKVIKDGKAVAQ
jgi:branched-chain amino acid transport system substrate-binding protein